MRSATFVSAMLRVGMRNKGRGSMASKTAASFGSVHLRYLDVPRSSTRSRQVSATVYCHQLSPANPVRISSFDPPIRIPSIGRHGPRILISQRNVPRPVVSHLYRCVPGSAQTHSARGSEGGQSHPPFLLDPHLRSVELTDLRHVEEDLSIRSC
jgi:hypothetical protein